MPSNGFESASSSSVSTDSETGGGENARNHSSVKKKSVAHSQSLKDNNYLLIVEPMERRLKLHPVEKGSPVSPSLIVLHRCTSEEIERYGILVDGSEQDSNDDNFIHCEDCRQYYESSCWNHPLYWVIDRVVTGGEDNRAARTLPAFFQIRDSSIPNAGKGVFANMDIPIGLVFGPYQGILLKDPKKADKDGYAWEIRQSFDNPVYVDGSDPKYSNWMRFINSSRWESEQNLIAFQHQGAVYYRVFKAIDSGGELLVWYGCKYGESLGVLSTQPSKRTYSKHPFILS